VGNLVQLSDVHTYLQLASGFTTDDTLLTQIITNVSAVIESYCRRSFSAVLSWVDVLDGGGVALALYNRPIVALSALADLSQRVMNEVVGTGNGTATSFTHTLASTPLQPLSLQVVAGLVVATDDGNGNLVGAGVATGSTVNYATGAIVLNLNAAPAPGTSIIAGYLPNAAVVSAALYSIDTQRGLIFPLPQPPQNFPIPAGLFEFLQFKPIWGRGERRWQISYTAGFSAVPADVQLAALMMVASRYNRRDALAQEEVGDYHYVAQSGPNSGFPAEVEQLLSPWREVVI
jgi:hypothetical protein